jgi:hypothetical protein
MDVREVLNRSSNVDFDDVAAGFGAAEGVGAAGEV